MGVNDLSRLITFSMSGEIAVEVAKALASEAAKRWSSHTAGVDVRVTVDDSAFAHHFSFLSNWSRQISLRDAHESKSLDEIYVALNLTTGRRGTRMASSTPLTLSAALVEYPKILLLGGPGAGKTTTVKHVIQQLLTTAPDESMSDADFPILVRCRELHSKCDLFDAILAALGVTVAFTFPSSWDNDKKHTHQAKHKDQLVCDLLNERAALLLIDGFDELPQGLFEKCYAQLARLLNIVNGSRVFVTARDGSVNATLEHCRTLWVKPLDIPQVEKLAGNWLKEETKVADFLKVALASPYRDSLDRPLNVAQLCMIFNSYGEIPSPPVLIYQRIISLHLEEWDRERGVQRRSTYGSFGPERKRQFLASMAYEMFKHGGAATISRSRLIDVYRKVHRRFGLAADQCELVVREIESHTGLLVSGGFDQYEFSHKSLQEYLVAEHIVRAPEVLSAFPQWRQLPDECAIAAALSSDPSAFLWALVKGSYEEVGHATDLFETERMLEFFWLRFLARVTIEKPGFEDGQTLALSVIYLDAMCWRRRDKNGRFLPREIRQKLRPALEVLLDELLTGRWAQSVAGLQVLESRSEDGVLVMDGSAGVPGRRTRGLPTIVVAGIDVAGRR
jgi:hypothetical protein